MFPKKRGYSSYFPPLKEATPKRGGLFPKREGLLADVAANYQPGKPPPLRDVKPTLGDMVERKLAGLFSGAMPERDAWRLAEKAITAGGLLGPVDPIGAHKSIRDSQLADAQGRPIAAMGNRSLAALMMIPGLGGLKKLGQEGVEQVAKGIRAYHVSPHDFDRFRIDNTTARTGEGAQTFGAGGYFMESPAVRDEYYRQFSQRMGNPTDARGIASELVQSIGPERALRELESRVDNLNKRRISAPETVPDRMLNARAPIEDALDILREGGRVMPLRYDVNINADPANLLDWDAPLSGQSDQVLDALQQLGVDPVKHTGLSEGSRVHGNISMRYGGEQGASQALLGAGIPGIKYLDQGSRAAGEGSRNYVIFDDKLIDILRKYGIAGGAIGTGGLLAAQQPQQTQY